MNVSYCPKNCDLISESLCRPIPQLFPPADRIPTHFVRTSAASANRLIGGLAGTAVGTQNWEMLGREMVKFESGASPAIRVTGPWRMQPLLFRGSVVGPVQLSPDRAVAGSAHESHTLVGRSATEFCSRFCGFASEGTYTFITTIPGANIGHRPVRSGFDIRDTRVP